MTTITSVEGNLYTIRPDKYIPLPSDVDYSSLRDYQVNDVKEILIHDCGLVQLYTGYGKTYIMSWLCKYLPKPILITEPTLALCDEIRSRIGEDNMSGIYIINPTAYWARKERDDLWLRDIKSLLSDEMMSVTDSIKKLFDNMPNLERIYGFSATPDKFRNARLQFIKNGRLLDETCSILQYYGRAIVYSKMKKGITLYEDELHLGQCKWGLDGYDHWKYKMAQDKVFKAPCLIEYIKSCRSRCSGPILFPFIDHKHIRWIFDAIELKGLRMAIWDASSIELNNGRKFTKTKPWIDKEGNKLEPYEIAKYMISNNQIDLIFCSSVGFKGVDFPELRNLILMVGANAGNILQIVGRVCRAEDPVIFLPKNLDPNPLYNQSYKKRLKWIESVQAPTINNLEV